MDDIKITITGTKLNYEDTITPAQAGKIVEYIDLAKQAAKKMATQRPAPVNPKK